MSLNVSNFNISLLFEIIKERMFLKTVEYSNKLLETGHLSVKTKLLSVWELQIQ